MKLDSCPFCSEQPTISKHPSQNLFSLSHRCLVLGITINLDWAPANQIEEKWNTRKVPKVSQSFEKKLLKWVKTHHWDSLERDKDLILRHMRTFAGDG